MSNAPPTIGAMASHTRCGAPTIRYYEQIGLMPGPGSTANGHRYYSRRMDMDTIALTRSLGLFLPRRLQSLWGVTCPCCG